MVIKRVVITNRYLADNRRGLVENANVALLFESACGLVTALRRHTQSGSSPIVTTRY